MKKGKEWREWIEAEIAGLKKRVKKLEGDAGWDGPTQKAIGLCVEWPEADIGGLRFNAQKTRGVFDLKEDGAYYSRDILFCSARDTDEGTRRDLLSEYLESEAVREAFLEAVKNHAACAGGVRVFLPEENLGVKKYNGVSSWHWLGRRSSGSAASFATVLPSGDASLRAASAVGGCAPAFRAKAEWEKDAGK